MATMTTSRTRASRQRLTEAAQARRAELAAHGTRRGPTPAGGQAASRSAQLPVDVSRSVAFPAVLRAKPVTYNGQDLVHLSGIASVTGVDYEMWDMFGPYDESVRTTAFDNTLAADPDVAFLVNHKGLTMARTVAMPGKLPTLVLGMREGPNPEDNGLGSDAYINPKRTDVSDLVIAVDDRHITEMSFAFMIVEGFWSDDFMHFEIAEVDINRGDVSAVNYGANPYTSIAARQQEILDHVRLMPPDAIEAAFRELARRADVDLAMLYEAYRVGEPQQQPRPAAPERAAVAATDTAESGYSVTHVEALLAVLDNR